MVSRRLVRVKIMQLMYAQNRGVDFDPKSMQVQLESSLKKTIQLQWVFLNYLVRISEYDLIHHAKQAGKETTENTGLLANHQLLLMLQQHPMYKRRIKDYQVESFTDTKLVRKLYLELISRERFNDFAKGRDSTDPTILSYMLKKLIAASDPLEDQLSNPSKFQWPNSYWFIAERTNGRLAMIGFMAVIINYTLFGWIAYPIL